MRNKKVRALKALLLSSLLLSSLLIGSMNVAAATNCIVTMESGVIGDDQIFNAKNFFGHHTSSETITINQRLYQYGSKGTFMAAPGFLEKLENLRPWNPEDYLYVYGWLDPMGFHINLTKIAVGQADDLINVDIAGNMMTPMSLATQTFEGFTGGWGWDNIDWNDEMSAVWFDGDCIGATITLYLDKDYGGAEITFTNDPSKTYDVYNLPSNWNDEVSSWEVKFPPPPASEGWNPMYNVSGNDLGAGATGHLKITSFDSVIYQFNRAVGWEQLHNITAGRIDVGSDGIAWTVSSGKIFQQTSMNSDWLEHYNFLAYDIAVFGESDFVAITTPAGKIFYKQKSVDTFLELYNIDSISRVAYDLSGHIWAVNFDGNIYRQSVPGGSNWILFPSPPAADITFDQDGFLWIANRDDGTIQKMNPIAADPMSSLTDYGSIGGYAQAVAVDAEGRVYASDEIGRIFVKEVGRYIDPDWLAIDGISVVDISYGANDTLVLADTVGHIFKTYWETPTPSLYPSDNLLEQYNIGSITRVALDAAGFIWAVTSAGKVYHQLEDGSWYEFHGVIAKDITVDPNDVVHVCETDGNMSFWSQAAGWEKVYSLFGCERIAVDNDGLLWVVLEDGRVYHHREAGSIYGDWKLEEGLTATDISIDESGRLYTIDKGTNHILIKDVGWSDWLDMGSITGIATSVGGNNGLIYAVRDDGVMFKKGLRTTSMPVPEPEPESEPQPKPKPSFGSASLGLFLMGLLVTLYRKQQIKLKS